MGKEKIHRVVTAANLLLIFFIFTFSLLSNSINKNLIILVFTCILFGIFNCFFIRTKNIKKTMSLVSSYATFSCLVLIETKAYGLKVDVSWIIIGIIIGFCLSFLYIHLLKYKFINK